MIILFSYFISLLDFLESKSFWGNLKQFEIKKLKKGKRNSLYKKNLNRLMKTLRKIKEFLLKNDKKVKKNDSNKMIILLVF